MLMGNELRADLRRMGLLKPIVGGRIRAITWKNDQGGLDMLGIIPSSAGIRFVKRDDEGKLAGVFVSYTYTPTMFGGLRKWSHAPGVEGLPASSMGSTACAVGDAED
jgi:hypothetical protein